MKFMSRKLKNIIKQNVHLLIEDDGDSMEMTQARLRSNDEDLSAAASKFGMGTSLKFTPMVAMGSPFEVSFEIKPIDEKIPVSWKGETRDVDGKVTKVISHEASIWLDPEQQKKIKKGGTDNQYKFKIVKLDGKEVTNDYMLFNGEELNIIDKRQVKTKQAFMGRWKKDRVVPQLNTGKKYSVILVSEETTEGEGGENENPIVNPNSEVTVPEEVKSGKNRNEIFRLLLKKYGGFNGDIVYGDGFKSQEDSSKYGKLSRDVKSGKVDKSELKNFRDSADRDPYTMMIANLRKSFPTNFMKKLSKAFPEFGITGSKSNIEESILKEEDNPDKYKRWGIIFPSNIISSKNVDILDKNIVTFMKAIKAYFGTPVVSGGKKVTYTINYDENAVNKYYTNFYSKNESFNLGKLINEVISRLTEDEGNSQKYSMQLIFDNIKIAGTERGEEVIDDSFTSTFKSLSKGKQITYNVDDYELNESSVNIDEVKKKITDIGEFNSFKDIIKEVTGSVGVVYDKSKGLVNINIGKTSGGKNVFINIPIKENGTDIEKTLMTLSRGGELKNCSIAYANPYKPYVSNVKIKIKISTK